MNKNFKPPYFITDLGDKYPIVYLLNNKKESLKRYGVWGYDINKGKNQVIETSNNLDQLMAKYNVKSNQVFPITK